MEEVAIVVKSMSFEIRQNHVNLPQLQVCFLICRMWTLIATRNIIVGIKGNCTIKCLVLCQHTVRRSMNDTYTTLYLFPPVAHSYPPSSLWTLPHDSLGMELLKTELYLQQPCYAKHGPKLGAFTLPENLKNFRPSQDPVNQNLHFSKISRWFVCTWNTFAKVLACYWGC